LSDWSGRYALFNKTWSPPAVRKNTRLGYCGRQLQPAVVHVDEPSEHDRPSDDPRVARVMVPIALDQAASIR